MALEGESLLRTILNRLKELEGVRHDTDLATPLGVSKEIVSQWKTRETIPWDRLIQYTRMEQVSFEWLINGHGPPRRRDLVAEPGAIYRVDTNHDALYRLAGDIYKAADEASARLTGEKFAQLMRLAHRETIDRGEPVPYAKIVELVKLAT